MSCTIAPRPRTEVIAVRDRRPARAGAAVAVEPGARAAAAGERDGRPTPVEIVPLLPVEHREKFWIVEAIDLAAHAADPLDEPGIPAEIEQAPADGAAGE